MKISSSPAADGTALECVVFHDLLYGAAEARVGNRFEKVVYAVVVKSLVGVFFASRHKDDVRRVSRLDRKSNPSISGIWMSRKISSISLRDISRLRADRESEKLPTREREEDLPTNSSRVRSHTGSSSTIIQFISGIHGWVQASLTNILKYSQKEFLSGF